MAVRWWGASKIVEKIWSLQVAPAEQSQCPEVFSVFPKCFGHDHMMSRVEVSLSASLWPGFSMMPSTADSPHGGLGEAQLMRSINTRLDSLDMDWFGLIWTDLDWFGLIWTDLDWFGLIWTDLDWFGLIWTDLDWFGLIWTDLDWLTPSFYDTS